MDKDFLKVEKLRVGISLGTSCAGKRDGGPSLRSVGKRAGEGNLCKLSIHLDILTSLSGSLKGGSGGNRQEALEHSSTASSLQALRLVSPPPRTVCLQPGAFLKAWP